MHGMPASRTALAVGTRGTDTCLLLPSLPALCGGTLWTGSFVTAHEPQAARASGSPGPRAAKDPCRCSSAARCMPGAILNVPLQLTCTVLACVGTFHTEPRRMRAKMKTESLPTQRKLSWCFHDPRLSKGQLSRRYESQAPFELERKSNHTRQLWRPGRGDARVPLRPSSQSSMARISWLSVCLGLCLLCSSWWVSAAGIPHVAWLLTSPRLRVAIFAGHAQGASVAHRSRPW